MDRGRVEAVADAIAGIGYDGIVAFDEHEPEYDTIRALYGEFEEWNLVQLLVVCATTQDFQLNGDAQLFWRTLTRIALEHGQLESAKDVEAVLWAFMEKPVNARFKSMKSARLEKLLGAGFPEWFLDQHREAEPLSVWERLAEGLGNAKSKKTVVLAMKIYDIAHLIESGEYLAFPYDIPIPCDLQVERVSRTTGITDAEEPERIMDAWAAVMEQVSDQLGRHISLLRIDSIVWQAGQVIGNAKEDPEESRLGLERHFAEVGIDAAAGERLADELTANLEYGGMR